MFHQKIGILQIVAFARQEHCKLFVDTDTAKCYYADRYIIIKIFKPFWVKFLQMRNDLPVTGLVSNVLNSIAEVVN